VVSTPQISKGPAGCRINRDFARRGWTTKTSDPNMGLRVRELRTRGFMSSTHGSDFFSAC